METPPAAEGSWCADYGSAQYARFVELNKLLMKWDQNEKIEFKDFIESFGEYIQPHIDSSTQRTSRFAVQSPERISDMDVALGLAFPNWFRIRLGHLLLNRSYPPSRSGVGKGMYEYIRFLDCILLDYIQRDKPQGWSETLQSVGISSSKRLGLGRYSLIRVAGEGGMGLVFLAKKASGRTGDRSVINPLLFAVKCIRPDERRANPSYDQFVEDRFTTEANATQVVRNGRAARVDGAWSRKEDGLLYLATEWVSGPTLADLLAHFASQPVPLAVALDVIHQIAAGLEDVHSTILAHCDIKPANIFLEGPRPCAPASPFGWWVRIGDFGLSLLNGDGPQSAAGGTPGYQSPEQRLGEPVGRSTDVYSLGIIAYELLTGRHPFRLDPTSFLPQYADWIPLRTLKSQNPDVPLELDTLVRRMLTARPAADRPEVTDVRKITGHLLEKLVPPPRKTKTSIATPPTPRANPREGVAGIVFPVPKLRYPCNHKGIFGNHNPFTKGGRRSGPSQISLTHRSAMGVIRDWLADPAGRPVFVVLGAKGAGKTCTLKEFACKLAAAPKAGTKPRPVPVYVDLAAFPHRAAADPALDEVRFAELVVKTGETTNSPDDVLAAVRDGSAILVLDGLEWALQDLLPPQVRDFFRVLTRFIGERGHLLTRR